MTDSTTIKLVHLFGRLKVSEIENAQSIQLLNAFGKNSLSELEAIPGYREAYARAKDVKIQLEEIAEQCVDNQLRQVKLCLRRMEDARLEYKTARLGLLGDLCRRWFVGGNRWGDDAKQLYNMVSPLIIDWQDYFFSYTNRGTPAINNDFRELIEYNFGRKLTDFMETQNCVARVIVKYISSHGSRGFFDAEHLQCGDDIEDRIKSSCTRAFTMVQFLEHQAFADPGEGRRNWCHEEYTLFRNAFDGLRQYIPHDTTEFENYFVITPPVEDTSKLFPAAALPPYKSWLDDVVRKKAIRLRNEKITALWEDFRPLVERIQTLRRALMDSMLYAAG